MTSEALRKILVCAVSFGLVIAAAACAPIAAAFPAVGGQTAQTLTANARQSYAVALATYDTATTAWDAAVTSGKLSKATVAQGRGIRLKLVDARKAALTAYHLGNAQDLGAQIGAITQLAGQLKALMPTVPA